MASSLVGLDFKATGPLCIEIAISLTLRWEKTLMAGQILKELEASGLKEPSERRTLVTKWVEGLYPGVESVTTETLQLWMETRPRELLLLDTRTDAEFAVSHLPGALLVPPDDAGALREVFKAWSLQERGSGGPRDLICYCTVGFRSSGAAELLSRCWGEEEAAASQGFGTSPRIYNVQGGLVKWAAEKRPMVDWQEKPTGIVHPYNALWATLLEPEFRAETQPAADG